MFGNLLKKNRSQDNEVDVKLQKLILKIDKMNLTEMRSFVQNNIKDLEVSSDSLNIVLQRLTKIDSTSKRSYINSDDMDSKKKKAFNLVLLIMTSKKINIQSIELVQVFLVTYEEIINEYDTQHKDIYTSRFKDAIVNAVAMIELISHMENKLNTLSE